MAIAITAGVVDVATATPLTFADRGSFDTAAGALGLITFDDFSTGALCLPSQPYVPLPCVLSTGGVTFTSSVGLPDFNQRPELTIDGDLGAPLSNGLASNAPAIAAGDFTIDFSGRALGLDVVTTLTDGDFVRILLTEVDGAESLFDIAAVIHAGTFFGVTSDLGFVGASLFVGVGRHGNFLIDNVATQTVPEPSTLLLTAPLVPWLVRRLRRRSAF